MATKILILCGAYLSLKVKLLIQFERSYYDLRNSLLSDDYTGAEYFLNLREWFRTFHMEKFWQKSTAATAWREWRNFVEKFTRKVWKMQSWVHIEKFSLEKYSFHGQVMLPHHSNQMSERSQVSRIAPWGCSLRVEGGGYWVGIHTSLVHINRSEALFDIDIRQNLCWFWSIIGWKCHLLISVSCNFFISNFSLDYCFKTFQGCNIVISNEERRVSPADILPSGSRIMEQPLIIITIIIIIIIIIITALTSIKDASGFLISSKASFHYWWPPTDTLTSLRIASVQMSNRYYISSSYKSSMIDASLFW